MRSLRLEFLRLNDLATGIWRQGDPYLVAAGNDEPIRQFTSPLEHETFLDLVRALRYQEDAQARESALGEIGAIAAGLLGTANLTGLATGSYPLHVDLVVNPAEVAALPFEAAVDAEGQPLFARADREVVLTRRVRHVFAEAAVRWPARPRVLYAWAAPPGAGDVPAEAHEATLRAALAPWLPADGTDDHGDVFRVVGETTLARLAEVCRTAAEQERPFTHVHLLAHGYPVGSAHKQHFGIALHADDGDLHAVTPEDIAKALAPLVGHAVVVTLATCDSANLTNTVVARRSVAHTLHQAGFPVVVASQFPLTVPGSNLMVGNFYEALLAGKDARIALHRTRVALHGARQRTGHDWASLVGYLRLPEGYAEHLLDVRLESVLASLKAIQARSDLLVERNVEDASALERVAADLRDRLAGLMGFLRDSEARGRRGVVEEHMGLIGSAEKRFAEVCFARSLQGDDAPWKQRSRDALRRSRDGYTRAYRRNLSHHWTGIQQLSLEALLDGRIGDRHLWHAVVAAAEIERKSTSARDAIWALGSLAEAYLLAPLAGEQPPADAARLALAEMKERLDAQPVRDPFPLESTARQMRRYVNWWTNANGFFPGTTDLAAEASMLARELGAG